MPRNRLIYVQTREASQLRPLVSIDRTATGAITVSVKSPGRSLREARERAQEEFSELLKYARKVQLPPTTKVPLGPKEEPK
jgi:hypothetical protein